MGVWKSVKKKLFKWHHWNVWERVDKTPVHKVIDEHGASCKVQTYWGETYRHRETGEYRRRVGDSCFGAPVTVFKERDHIETNKEYWQYMGRDFSTEPAEQWVEEKPLRATIE